MEIEIINAKASKIIEVWAEIQNLEEQVEAKKESIRAIKAEVYEYFVASKRETPFTTPAGTLYLRHDLSIPAPRGPKLKELFEHFSKNFGEEMAWEKMSINTMTLKSEVKQHIASVEARGDDPNLELLPGVDTPREVKSIQFRKGRK